MHNFPVEELYLINTSNYMYKKSSGLYLISIFFIIVFLASNLEVSEFVGILILGYNTEPVTELVLLQEFLGQVLEIPIN